MRLHLYEQGTGQPAVVLESGLAATSLTWALVQSKIARFTRVCSYDRLGLGWSDRCSKPRTVHQMAAELAAVLHAANIPPPYILVGHSFGGLLIRAYAHLNPENVIGLVFVDPVSLEFWAHCDPAEGARLLRGVRLSRRGALLARFGIVRAALTTLAAGGRRIPKLTARATAGRASELLKRLAGEIQKLPPAVWPMVRAHWSRSSSFHAMARYLACLPAAAEAALQMPIPVRIPFTILSASTATERELAERDAWVRLSENARHIHIERSGHWLPLEHPDVVVAAVRDLIETLHPTP
jgi:pimeloyl-ACP methyl ester carboxylesterase